MSMPQPPAQNPQASPKSLFERDFLPGSPTGFRNHCYRLLFHHDTPGERNFDLALIATIVVSNAKINNVTIISTSVNPLRSNLVFFRLNLAGGRFVSVSR